MEKIKLVIEWCQAHPAAVSAIALACYPALDAVVRLVIPAAKVAEWERAGGKVARAAARVYRILEKVLATNR